MIYIYDICIYPGRLRAFEKSRSLDRRIWHASGIALKFCYLETGVIGREPSFPEDNLSRTSLTYYWHDVIDAMGERLMHGKIAAVLPGLASYSVRVARVVDLMRRGLRRSWGPLIDQGDGPFVC